jgi:hypothetical protein
MGVHKLIHGYSGEYPLFLAKENHFVFNPHILQILAIFQYPPNILVQHQQ